MNSMQSLFKTMVFDEKMMKKHLSPKVYASLKKTMTEGTPLDAGVADAVAVAMKDWAVEQGATHFTHWFQPLTGITAEKHDSFIEPGPEGGALLDFSGKELIKGEPDASSFPSGGLRSTFEARGYTAWDPTSYAFIKGKSLCIPTAYCCYNGEALDQKTPLLRSMDALNHESLRILRLLGDKKTKRVSAMVGAEQEYFLIPEELYLSREDLRLTGRTLYGALPPKGQELDDHFFGAIKPAVASFMEELNEELWKLGIYAKTEHNEVAPSQHELACIYNTVNIATDQNQLTMEMMKRIAKKHGLVCLLHEKPFDGVNGSGKHNNWSVATDDGENLLSPGDFPGNNLRFLLFLSAVIKAVDDYADLLRISVATAGNDHRLGGGEAPPAIVSMFLGNELTGVLDAIEQDLPAESRQKVFMGLGVSALPDIKKDNTDRNRTSPFAFTGNKFEFRMPGSSDNISGANIVINSSVAYVLRGFADRLEQVPEKELNSEIYRIVKETYSAHKRVIFNGNGYDAEWLAEAARRGLPNFATTACCMPHLTDPKNILMFGAVNVFSEAELRSRQEIVLENYCKTIRIEARTMIDIARTQILPVLARFTKELAETAHTKTELRMDCSYESGVANFVSGLEAQIYQKTNALDERLLSSSGDSFAESAYIRDELLPLMAELRRLCDNAERQTAKDLWPMPPYGELLFGVQG